MNSTMMSLSGCGGVSGNAGQVGARRQRRVALVLYVAADLDLQELQDQLNERSRFLVSTKGTADVVKLHSAIN
jgi:hypothetical protein